MSFANRIANGQVRRNRVRPPLIWIRLSALRFICDIVCPECFACENTTVCMEVLDREPGLYSRGAIERLI